MSDKYVYAIKRATGAMAVLVSHDCEQVSAIKALRCTVRLDMWMKTEDFNNSGGFQQPWGSNVLINVIVRAHTNDKLT